MVQPLTDKKLGDVGVLEQIKKKAWKARDIETDLEYYAINAPKSDYRLAQKETWIRVSDVLAVLLPFLRKLETLIAEVDIEFEESKWKPVEDADVYYIDFDVVRKGMDKILEEFARVLKGVEEKKE